MAVNPVTPYKDYTNISEIKNYWISRIAPNYFDLSNYNNYNAGIFGYVNEIMANTTEDAFNATAITRREFYPISAQFISSLYAMATLQSIEIPLCTPATCKAALVIPQQEIIDNSTFRNGLYECTIDNCLKIYAGDLQFMLDYPIKILSKKTTKWTHTAHYDISVSNSLNKAKDSRYISNKIIKDSGLNYVILFIDCIRQLEMVEISNVVIKDSVMDTITMDVDFDGALANFEVFYKETSNSAEQQLQKVMINSSTPNVPFVQYELVNQNKIRYTFTFNPVFNPQYNSEIITRIYTSEGKNGNFNAFADDLVCSSDSEKYPYNSSMTILGQVNGSSSGGRDQMLDDEFRNKVLKAYSTNNTITTSSDLQIHFDDLADDIENIRVLFKKKRDDPLIRLWGAYCVIKDENKNVIPTNTLTIECLKSDIVKNPAENTKRMIIPPGALFEYKGANGYTLVPSKKMKDNFNLSSFKIQKGDSTHYFSNPFLIAINVSPNNVGYYMNSINKYMSIDYTYINDDSAQQFIGSGLHIYRNSICGNDYYKMKMTITSASELEAEKIYDKPDTKAPDYEIRAKYNGKIIKSELYQDKDKKISYVRYTVEYDVGEEEAENRFEYIQASNTIPINSQPVTGYKMQFEVGDSFIKDDILATKRITDKGNLLILGDINYHLYPNGYYLPFTLQEYDEEMSGYVFEAYLKTDDTIDLSEKLTITGGIYDSKGEENDFVAIEMKNLVMELNVLYNNDGNNIANKYTKFKGLNNYTLTNTYNSSESEKFNLITPLQYIRSVVDFSPHGDDTVNYKITISESPVLGAQWASNLAWYDYFISKYLQINDKLNEAYFSLENNFSIDSKFYNTYGKAKFYSVGNSVDSMQKLDNVKCRFHFGVSLNIISSTEQFINDFRHYIQEYIESDDKITSMGQDLFVMNMISALRAQFTEINYIEYYGFNTYDYMAQKIIGPNLNAYQEGFIPEFLNLDTITDSNGVTYPNIEVDILR